MTTNKELGRLKRVKLRDAWETEAGDFTPWLAGEENIALLGDTLGLDLEVEAQEKSVGPFRADILCKDTTNDHWVLIENQLERTDHTHLGQLITYAAGLNTVTVVWVASRFTDEHRAAMDWLNEVTAEGFSFFALEIELWQIGDSAVAPKFNIVSSPNDWSKKIHQAASNVKSGVLTETQAMQLEYWTGFKTYLEDSDTNIKAGKPYPQHWTNVSMGRSGFSLVGIISQWDSVSESYANQEIRVDLNMYDNHAKNYYQQLEALKDTLAAELGENLIWHNPENKKSCRISLRKVVEVTNRDRWPEYHEWMKDKMELMRKVLGPIVKKLDTSVGVE
jgi:hypothetical protein